MSLVRLLTSGKSLVGLKNVTSRYQMRSGHLLPKFGAEKNPFAAPAPSEEPAPADSAPAAYQMSPAEMEAASLKETKKLPTASAPEPKPVAARPAAATLVMSWLIGWARKLNPLEKLARRRPQLKSAITRFRTAAVQGEFSLENIRVARNDLSDTDVEVVAARPGKSKPKPAPVEAAARTAEFAGTQSTID